MILSTPGLARAGSLGGAVFGLAPSFYSIACVKGLERGTGGWVPGAKRGIGVPSVEYAGSIIVFVSAVHPPVTLAMHSEELVCMVSSAVGMRIA